MNSSEWETMTDRERAEHVLTGGELTKRQLFDAIEHGSEELKQACQRRMAERLSLIYSQVKDFDVVAHVGSNLMQIIEAAAAFTPDKAAYEVMGQWARSVEASLAALATLFDNRPTIEVSERVM